MSIASPVTSNEILNSEVNKDLVTNDSGSDGENDEMTQEEAFTKLYDFLEIKYLKFYLYLTTDFAIAEIDVPILTTAEISLRASTEIIVLMENTQLLVTMSPPLLIDAPYPIENVNLFKFRIVYGVNKIYYTFSTDTGISYKIEDELRGALSKALPQITKDTNITKRGYEAFKDKMLLDTITSLIVNFLNVQWSDETSTATPTPAKDYSVFINPKFNFNAVVKKIVSQTTLNSKNKKSGIEIPKDSQIQIELLLNDNLKELQSKTDDYKANKVITLGVEYLTIQINTIYVFYNGDLILEIRELRLKQGEIDIPNYTPHGFLALADGIDAIIDLLKLALAKQMVNKNPLLGLSPNAFSGVTKSKTFQKFLYDTLTKFISDMLKKEIFKQPVIKNIDILSSLGIK